MDKTYLQHVERMKRTFELVAYASLGIDMAITIVTLLSANTQNHALQGLQSLLNWALSAVFIVSAILLIAIAFMSHYEKIIDQFARIGFNSNSKKRLRQRKLQHYR
jgi:hypothetical protein